MQQKNEEMTSGQLNLQQIFIKSFLNHNFAACDKFGTTYYKRGLSCLIRNHVLHLSSLLLCFQEHLAKLETEIPGDCKGLTTDMINVQVNNMALSFPSDRSL